MAAASRRARPPGPTDGYRIDDLARVAGTTVRNVRAYQDRGLLPPPARVGRVGWYSEAHLARLRLIGELLGRGYSLANIAELIESWVRGQDLSDLLGLEAPLVAPWGADPIPTFSREELRELFAPLGAEHLDTAIDLGLITAEGDNFRVADPRLIEGATVLVDAGVPVETVFVVEAEIAAATDHIVRLYVEMINTHVVGEAADLMPPEQVRHLTEVVRRLSPLAQQIVDAGLAAALDRRLAAEVGEHLAGADRAGATAS